MYIHSLTPGVAAVGFALGLRSIAGFLFGPFTGVLADRLDRRRVMIVCDLARAALVAALPFTHVVWEAYALAFASAILSPLFRSSRAALLPQVAPGPKLVPALTVAETTHHVLHTVGPALGGLVVLLVGARNGFFVDAASFVVSAGFLSTIRRRGRPSAESRSALREFGDGLVALVRTPAVRTYSLLNAAVAFSGAGLVALLVVWAFVSALAGGAFLLVLAHPSFLVLLLLGLPLGLLDGGIDVPSSAAEAELLADRFRGRAAGASQGFGDLLFASGSILFAWLGEPARLGIEGAMALAGTTGVALALAVLALGGGRAIAESERTRLAALRRVRA